MYLKRACQNGPVDKLKKYDLLYGINIISMPENHFYECFRWRKKMGVEKEIFYIDYIRVIYACQSEKQFKEYKENEITDSLLEKIKVCIDNNTFTRMEFKSLKNDIGMTIYYENGLSHIGIVDMYNDLVYYFCNGTKDETLIDIAGQMFASDMVCRSNDILYKIITYYVRTGKRYPHVKWIKD